MHVDMLRHRIFPNVPDPAPDQAIHDPFYLQVPFGFLTINP